MTGNINQTGPAYPPPPAAGSNGIGAFQIGVSPIGDISPFSVWSTILSQYANAPEITGVLQAFAVAADQTANIDAFFDNIWNVDTATGYGLDVWGRIVGVTRILHIATGPSYFGFAEALPGSLGFNTGVSLFNGTWVESNVNQGGGSFFTGAPLTSNYRLDDPSYRKLILAKAAFNITDGSIASINTLLQNLFPNRGNAFVTDGFHGGVPYFGFAESQNALTFGQGIFYNGQNVASMVMAYNFAFPLTPVEIAIVTQSGALPRPTGIHASVVVNGVIVVP